MGTCPQYEVKTLRQCPALFQALVSLQGGSFDGDGSTKKQARHEAARKDCRGTGDSETDRMTTLKTRPSKCSICLSRMPWSSARAIRARVIMTSRSVSRRL